MKKSKKTFFNSQIKKIAGNVQKNAKKITEQDSEYSQYNDALKTATKKISPRLKHAAKKTEDYLKNHEKEINENAQKGGKFIARQALRMATPPVLRPAIDAMKDELSKKKKSSNSKD